MTRHRGPAIRVPPPPADTGEIVRLVDPTGTAMAWIAVTDGARVIAAYRLRDTEWVSIDPGEPGRPLSGAWTLLERDPTSCLLGRNETRVRITIQDGHVTREVLDG